MKNFKLLLAALVAVVSISSCMKDDNNYDNSYEENLKRIDTVLKKQAPILEKYAHDNFTNPKIDSATGIWYEELAAPTDPSYEYTITSTGYFVTPQAKVKYSGELMDGTVFDAPSTPVDFMITTGTGGVIQAWTRAFYPKTIVFNGETYTTGLVEDGLKKGSKIRFISPSPWCYDNQAREKIPADSPLVFTIEVTEIKDASY